MRPTHTALFVPLLLGGCHAETIETIGTYTTHLRNARLGKDIEIIDTTSQLTLTLTVRKGPVRVDPNDPSMGVTGEPTGGFSFSVYQNEIELWAELSFEGEMTLYGFPFEGPKDALDERAKIAEKEVIDCTFVFSIYAIDVTGRFNEDFSEITTRIPDFGNLTFTAEGEVDPWSIPESVGEQDETDEL